MMKPTSASRATSLRKLKPAVILLLVTLFLGVHSAPLHGETAIFHVPATVVQGVPPAPEPFPIAVEDDCDARRPDVAGLPGGGFVVAWAAEEIAARLFDRDRRSADPDFRVNTVVEGVQTGARVTALPGGGFAIAWWDAAGHRVVARFFGGDGVPLGGEVTLATLGMGFFPEIALAAHPDGTIWVVWETFDAGLQGGRFAPDGTPLASFAAGGNPAFELQIQPSLAVDTEGHLILAWARQAGGLVDPPFPARVLARRFDADGTPIEDILAVTPEDFFPGLEVFGPSVAALPFGGFLVSWIGNADGGAYFRRFDAAGEPLTPPVQAGLAGKAQRSDPSDGVDVAVLPDGRFVVAWDALTTVQPLPPPGTPGGIVGRIFQAGGSPAAPAMRLDADFDLGQRAPRLAVLDTGNVAAVWWTELELPPILPPDCSRSGGVFGRVLNFDCLPGNGDLCLGNQQRFRVTVNWQDPFNGGSGSGRAIPLTPDTGAFWFFDPDNLELTVKVIDGRPVNNHFWFFYGALTNVGYQITITDRVTGTHRTYENPPGEFGSLGDTGAFLDTPPPPGTPGISSTPAAVEEP